MNDHAPVHDAATVRAAKYGDVAEIARIYNHYVDAGGSTFDMVHWTADDVIKSLRIPEPDGWFVGVDQSQMLGWCSAHRFSRRHGYRQTCETAIYLDPRAMGSGIADQLQTRLEEHCRRCNLHHAVAKIIAGNERSIAFHRRHGYELVGIQNEVGNIDGQWIDVAILQKVF